MSVNTRIDRIESTVNSKFLRQRESAQMALSAIFDSMSRQDKELMMDATQADWRGDPLPEGAEEVFRRFEELGGFKAGDRLEEFTTDEDRARSSEKRRRMSAGEDWREIDL